MMLLPTTYALGAFITYLIVHDAPINFFWIMQAKVYYVSLMGKPSSEYDQVAHSAGVLNSRTSLRSASASPQYGGTIPDIKSFPLDEVTIGTNRTNLTELTGVSGHAGPSLVIVLISAVYIHLGAE
jgi:hypothetical protein